MQRYLEFGWLLSILLKKSEGFAPWADARSGTGTDGAAEINTHTTYSIGASTSY